MEFHPMAAKMFHADGHTELKQLTVTFHNFVNMSKMGDIPFKKDDVRKNINI